MSRAARSAVLFVFVHLIVTVIHGLAHVLDGILPGPTDTSFVIFVIYITPLIAVILLWRQAQSAGALLLALSMAGALFYGLAGHFILSGADNVAQQMPGFWPIVFQITAVLLVPLEALGCILGLRLLAITQRMRSAHRV